MPIKSPRQWTPPKTPFAARVQRALMYAELSHSDAAHRMSNRIGQPFKPQTIQYMSVSAAKSTYTADLAAICGVDAQWLAQGIGNVPGSNPGGNVYSVREPALQVKPKPSTAGEKLTHLIEAHAISDMDMQLLLQMAERMAKHASNGA